MHLAHAARDLSSGGTGSTEMIAQHTPPDAVPGHRKETQAVKNQRALARVLNKLAKRRAGRSEAEKGRPAPKGNFYAQVLQLARALAD